MPQPLQGLARHHLNDLFFFFFLGDFTSPFCGPAAKHQHMPITCTHQNSLAFNGTGVCPAVLQVSSMYYCPFWPRGRPVEFEVVDESNRWRALSKKNFPPDFQNGSFKSLVKAAMLNFFTIICQMAKQCDIVIGAAKNVMTLQRKITWICSSTCRTSFVHCSAVQSASLLPGFTELEETNAWTISSFLSCCYIV